LARARSASRKKASMALAVPDVVVVAAAVVPSPVPVLRAPSALLLVSMLTTAPAARVAALRAATLPGAPSSLSAAALRLLLAEVGGARVAGTLGAVVVVDDDDGFVDATVLCGGMLLTAKTLGCSGAELFGCAGRAALRGVLGG